MGVVHDNYDCSSLEGHLMWQRSSSMPAACCSPATFLSSKPRSIQKHADTNRVIEAGAFQPGTNALQATRHVDKSYLPTPFQDPLTPGRGLEGFVLQARGRRLGEGGATVCVGFVLFFFCRVCPGFFGGLTGPATQVRCLPKTRNPKPKPPKSRDLGCLNPNPFKARSPNMKPFL